MQMIRQIVPMAAILSLLCATIPAPSAAMSTQTEIQLGRQEDESIVGGSVVETDPLLNAYVQSIADKLWKQVARKDVPYNLKIIKDKQVNAFSTMGGYLYVYDGVIDFVQSDDELAGVIAHETGHIERRHEVTMQSKAQAMNLLFGLASFISPFIYNFGNLIEAGAMAKMQRADELQADRTGLQLMSRAGFDPESMETITSHLAVLESQHSDLLTKYLQDHPNPKARVSHLVGYPELDPKIVTEEQRIVQAASDEERARYSFANSKLTDILKSDPNNAEALLELGQSQLALGYTSKSEQTLAEASQKGSPETRALATQRIAALRQMEAQRVTLVRPNLGKLRDLLAQVQATQLQASQQIIARRDQGNDQLKQINARTDALRYEIPNFNNVNVAHGSRLESVFKNLTAMSRSINSALGDDGDAIGGVGSLEKNKESGLLRESRDILKEMQAPLDLPTIPADSVAVLPSYPSMFAQLQQGDSDMVRAVDGARVSLTALDQSLGDLDELFKALAQAPINFQRTDISEGSYTQMLPIIQRATTGFNEAATEASQAAQLYNMARVRQISTRITLLAVGTSPARYDTLRYALNHRFQSDGIDYRTMLHDNITPGDVTVATILAADIKSTPEAIVSEMMKTKKSPVDLADEHGMHAWPLEILTGLIYLDYTDDPHKEMTAAT
ncbi:MAG: M48 family metalloprotease [Candidatus Eremiobacteraeota bacterium]|nr:M48 family metalloprotease [Candidatus Eremiobacteraeota bacterium]